MTSSERKRRHRQVVAPATDGVAEQDRSELVDAEPADLPTARKARPHPRRMGRAEALAQISGGKINARRTGSESQVLLDQI
ncbi:hypothetical protein [Ornithinimicrobium sp. INDO-MA30-4]|uniref:hypothetical protein n=1 Tax=Ornithinimicrobium sp. INDO-MA30-4 TaxID=2908651 RepID=UPI001F3C02FD|nr:hypothetical protein [Ornithinimicrobium sp. INDO-MA30-4]UJH70560.1 hypothetical protein L0A91_16180 [Ornithinimicrobium sp. INDO-MA30-4]